MYNHLSKKKIALLSLGIVLLCYCIAIAFGPMTYHTNDDAAWQSMVSRFTFEALWWHPPFPSILLTYPIGVLCRFIPQVPWWYVISQLFVATGMLVVHYVFLRLGQIKNASFPLVILLLGIFDAVYHVVCITEIAWTIVPVITGSGILAMVFYYPYIENSRKKGAIAYIIIGAVLSLAHRYETGIIVIAFLLLSIAYILAKKHGFLRKKMIVRMVGVTFFSGILILGLSTLNEHINGVSQSEEWQNYSSARSAFIDFKKDSYEKNPELYASVGWTEDTYEFAKKWVFLSDEITEDAFRYISENSESRLANMSVWHRLHKAYSEVKSDERTKHTFLVSVIAMAVSFIWISYRRKWLDALFAVINGIGVVVLFLYLGVFVGRTLFRTVFIILYPGVLVSLFLMLYNYEAIGNKNGKKIFSGIAILSLLMIGISLCSLMDTICARKITFKEKEHNQLLVEAYLHNHPENSYVVQGFDAISYKRYSPEPETNQLSTGGTMWESNWWKQMIKDNKLKTMNWEIFESQNVYYLGELNDQTKHFLEYLQEKYDCKGIAVIEPMESYIGSRFSMKFVYNGDEQTYDSYYSIVDGELTEVVSSKKP